jgi:hypothetical protein
VPTLGAYGTLMYGIYISPIVVHLVTAINHILINLYCVLQVPNLCVDFWGQLDALKFSNSDSGDVLSSVGF